MSNLIFVDTLFDKENTKEYSLSIRVSSGGFSFCIFKQQNCLVISKTVNYRAFYNTDLVSTFKDFVQNHELLNVKYQQVKIVWEYSDYTTIPNAFFTDEFANYSYQLCCGRVNAKVVLWNKMEQFEAYLVYAMPKAFYQLIKQLYPDITIIHGNAIFFENTIVKNALTDNTSVFAKLSADYCTVIIPNAENKHFTNSFKYKTATDLVYFLLNIYKQQQLNTENTKLILSGEIALNDGKEELLKKYIANVEVNELPKKYCLKSDIEDKMYNSLVNLLNSELCE